MDLFSYFEKSAFGFLAFYLESNTHSMNPTNETY